MSTAQKPISNELAEELRSFIEDHSPAEFSRNLRRILLDQLLQYTDIGTPLYMKDFLHAMYDFFELLDVAEREVEK